MKALVATLALLCAGVLSAGCVSYSGISRHGDAIYITGATTFLIFSEHWVKKCTPGPLEGSEALTCHQLEVTDLSGPPTYYAPSTSAPAPSPAAAWSTATAIPKPTTSPAPPDAGGSALDPRLSRSTQAARESGWEVFDLTRPEMLGPAITRLGERVGAPAVVQGQDGELLAGAIGGVQGTQLLITTAAGASTSVDLLATRVVRVGRAPGGGR